MPDRYRGPIRLLPHLLLAEDRPHALVGRCARLVPLAWVLAITVATPAWAAPDPYLEAIKDEASSPEYLDAAKREEAEMQQRRDGSAPIAAGLADFEQLLLAELPGSYALYLTLKPRQKEEVYKAYTTADPDAGYGRFIPAIRLIIKYSIEN